MESRLITRDGVTLHGLWRPGHGTPIVVLPGAMADARSYVPVAEAIDRPEPVLVLDRRGRGLSGPQGARYSFETEVADLRRWLDDVDEPATVVGWSYGATIALDLAARDPRIRHVVGYEPVLAPFGAALLPALRAADPDTRVTIINRDLSRVAAEAVEALRTDPVWPTLRRLSGPAVAELEAINAFRPDDSWSAVAADLIVGERSTGTEPYGPAFDRAAAHLPRATTTVLPGHGHLAHVEDPAALGRVITALLSGRAGTGQPANASAN